MIRYMRGNLLDADVEALVNPVNAVGVMGKGLAAEFKTWYPDIFKEYATACKQDKVQIGSMFVTEAEEFTGPRWVIHFPTKQHWRDPTKLKWVEDGLRDLQNVIGQRRIHSIAIPALGCGNGGLEWPVVRGLIESTLSDLDDVEIVVYEPVG